MSYSGRLAHLRSAFTNLEQAFSEWKNNRRDFQRLGDLRRAADEAAITRSRRVLPEPAPPPGQGTGGLFTQALIEAGGNQVIVSDSASWATRDETVDLTKRCQDRHQMLWAALDRLKASATLHPGTQCLAELIVPGVATEDRLRALLDSFSVVLQDIAPSPKKHNPRRPQKQADPAVEALRQIDKPGANGQRLSVRELCRLLKQRNAPVPVGVLWTVWDPRHQPVKTWISKRRKKA
jgi:hypothetical protein